MRSICNFQAWHFRFKLPIFCGPLISHKLPFVGAKLTPNESIFYLLLLAGSTAALQIARMFVKKLVATADEILAIDHRKPVIYFRSFENELSKSKVGFRKNGWWHNLDCLFDFPTQACRIGRLYHNGYALV